MFPISGAPEAHPREEASLHPGAAPEEVPVPGPVQQASEAQPSGGVSLGAPGDRYGDYYYVFFVKHSGNGWKTLICERNIIKIYSKKRSIYLV